MSQQRALESLRGDGLAIVPFSELIGDDQVWAELAEDASDFASTAEEHLAGQPRRKVGRKIDGSIRLNSIPSMPRRSP